MERLKILIVDDEKAITDICAMYLEHEGYEVFISNDGKDALEKIKSNSFDLLVLDLMLPYYTGEEITQIIRKTSTVPIIILTAKQSEQSKIEGLSIGADDYITKPFDEEELLWKIKAVIRRIPDNKNEVKAEIIKIGKYTFDFSNQSLSIAGQTKRITERENEIFNYLSGRRNNVIKPEELLKDLWGENYYFFGRSLDVFITKIRKYLKYDPALSIENVFKVGFIFNVPEE